MNLPPEHTARSPQQKRAEIPKSPQSLLQEQDKSCGHTSLQSFVHTGHTAEAVPQLSAEAVPRLHTGLIFFFPDSFFCFPAAPSFVLPFSFLLALSLFSGISPSFLLFISAILPVSACFRLSAAFFCPEVLPLPPPAALSVYCSRGKDETPVIFQNSSHLQSVFPPPLISLPEILLRTLPLSEIQSQRLWDHGDQ